MRRALNDTGRPIVYSLCEWGVADPWTWAPEVCAPTASAWHLLLALLVMWLGACMGIRQAPAPCGEASHSHDACRSATPGGRPRQALLCCCCLTHGVHGLAGLHGAAAAGCWAHPLQRHIAPDCCLPQWRVRQPARLPRGPPAEQVCGSPPSSPACIPPLPRRMSSPLGRASLNYSTTTPAWRALPDQGAGMTWTCWKASWAGLGRGGWKGARV